MQVPVVGVLVAWSMEVLTVTTGLAHLMVLTGISWASILAISVLAITVTVLTVSLWGVSKTRKDNFNLKIEIIAFDYLFYLSIS